MSLANMIHNPSFQTMQRSRTPSMSNLKSSERKARNARPAVRAMDSGHAIGRISDDARKTRNPLPLNHSGRSTPSSAPGSTDTLPSYDTYSAACPDSTLVSKRRARMAENVWNEVYELVGDRPSPRKAPRAPEDEEEDPVQMQVTHANEVYVRILVSSLDTAPDANPFEVERTVRANLAAVGFPLHLCTSLFLPVARDVRVA